MLSIANIESEEKCRRNRIEDKIKRLQKHIQLAAQAEKREN
jgi:hypothetical protein